MKAIQTTNIKGGNSRFSLKNNHYIKLLSNINRTGLFSAFAFLLLALTCLFPISKSEQNTEAVTGTVQSSSLTLNVSSSAASVELDVNSNTGTFASSTTDNSAAFSVTTNNFSGYTLTISGNDDEGKLYDSTKQNFLTSLANATSETDFSSTANTNLNGKWGYKPSKFNSVANANYLPAPTTTASTLDTTSVANTTANDYTISLGLRADYTTTADTYSNSFIITAVPNPIAYVITYDANTTDTVSNMPAAQNSTTSATEITLSDKTPAREGYDFKGWCTVAPTTANPDTCTGTTFQPGGTYGIDQTSENITVLYAIWKKQIIYIQDYSYAQCSTEAVDAPATVVDKRDNKEYTVRYINGICTMTQNLDFELTTGMTLSPDTTNVTMTRTLGTVGSLTAGDSYDEPRTAKNSNITGAGLHYNYAAATAGTITGSSNSTEATQDICPKGWRLPTLAEQTSITGTSQDNFSTTNVTAFNAVAAGFYFSGSLNDSGFGGLWWSSTADGNASRYSLFYDTTLGLYSGNIYYRGSSVRNRGLSVRCVKAKPGVTISFNANGGTGTMDMQKIDAGQSANLTANTFTRTDYVFTGWNTKADGTGTTYADASLYTAPVSEDNKIVVLYAQWVPAMQSFTSSQCQAQATDEPVTLGDVRDGKTYTVRYINGNCWMTQNLRFAMATGMTLSPTTSNVSTDTTLGIIGDLTSGSNYTEARVHDSGNTTNGYWYNYCATTAGTVCSQDKMDATYDICPTNWRLPTYTEHNSITGTSYISAYSPITGGNYNNLGQLNSSTYGYWWSSTAYDESSQYRLWYHENNRLGAASGFPKTMGFYVRCVLKQ